MAIETWNCARVMPQSDRCLMRRFSKRRRISSELKPPSPMMSKMVDHLLVEVFIRVAEPKFRRRCKLVCKQWNSVMSDPYFVRRFNSHHRIGELDSETSLVSTESVLSFIRVPDKNQFGFRVFDSFKDLLLCGFAESDELGRSYLLCNPSTKQWISLPVAPEKPEGSDQAEVRLVCEPLSSNNLDLGGNHVQGFVYPTQYRFRVVCIYQHNKSIKLDVFCSESGEWTKEALVLNGYLKLSCNRVCSCDGKLFWSYVKAKGEFKPLLAALNPFRLDIPFTSIKPPSVLREKPWWNISVSQGALHLIAFEGEARSIWWDNVLSVWRLEEGNRSWSRLHKGLLQTSMFEKLHTDVHFVHHLHPEKPEMVFLEIRGDTDACTLGYAILSCNLKSSKVLKVPMFPWWTVFQPRVSCWPTPIPRYEQLRGTYHGRYKWLVQSNN